MTEINEKFNNYKKHSYQFASSDSAEVA